MAVEIKDINGGNPVFAQWECDRVLVISGTTEMPICRFAHQALTHAIPVNGTASGENWTVKVPNILLQMGGAFGCAVVVENSSDEIVEIASARFCVKPRKKPLDYEYTDNIGYVNWVQLSQEAQNLVDTIQMMLDTGALKGDAFTYDDFTQAQLAALKGPAGVSPGITISDIEGGHRVTITDAEHPQGQSFDVMDGEDVEGGGSTITVDDALSSTSTNPVQNKVVKAALDEKGTYSKPSGGIPASDLASAVQTSLGKADTALQSVPSTYRTAAAQDTIDSGKIDKPSNPSSGAFLVWNGTAWVAQTLATWQGGSY